MFLILDNTEDKKVVFYLSLNKKFIQQNYATSRINGLVFCLDKLLIKYHLKLKDIDFLGVVAGEGKFTASRLSATFANTLAYSLKIPVFTVPKNFDQNLISKLVQSAKAGEYIIPVYSAEARIG